MVRSHNFGDQGVSASQSNLKYWGCDPIWGSFSYQIKQQVVKGLTLEVCHAGKLTPDLEKSFVASISALEVTWCLYVLFKVCYSVFLSCDLDDVARPHGTNILFNFNCRVVSDIDSYCYPLVINQTWQYNVPHLYIIFSSKSKPASIGDVPLLWLIPREGTHVLQTSAHLAIAKLHPHPLQWRALIIHHHPSKPINESSYIIHMCVYIYIHIITYILCTYTYIYIYIIYIHIHIHIYIYRNIYIYTQIYIYIYNHIIYLYIYTYVSTSHHPSIFSDLFFFRSTKKTICSNWFIW